MFFENELHVCFHCGAAPEIHSAMLSSALFSSSMSGWNELVQKVALFRTQTQRKAAPPQEGGGTQLGACL